ncbi:hypothetical protein QT972_33980, partial [Microcoleus sp. herbarium7]|uniref:esterase/lipase family protein n=1 Tax=Microcoleus sp. herbarium7 TaxID=3055435 RepID=UPI002FD6463B
MLGNDLRLPTQTNGYDIVVLNFPQYRRGGLTSQTYPCPIPASYVPRPGQPTREQLCQQAGYPRTVTFGPPEETVDGGADYIERNAMVLVELIRRTNATLRQNNSTEKIVIIGPSMGGLISRYALAYMEKKGISHCCKLFISFDSPHLGANIPIGMQQFVKFFADYAPDSDAHKAWYKKLNSPAARQQLLHHLNRGSEAQAPDLLRNVLLDTLDYYGWPQVPFRVAIANGAGNGKGLAYLPSQLALNLETKLKNWVR